MILLLAIGCGDSPTVPDAASDDGSATGLVWGFVGYPPEVNSSTPDGMVYGAFRSRTALDSVLGTPVMDLGFFRAMPAFAPCMLHDLVWGDLLVTEASDGAGRAEFSFPARSQDGGTSVQHTLGLDGGAHSGSWPVGSGSTSHFEATNWSITSEGGGCNGNGTFDEPVRVDVRHLAKTTVNPGTPPFLNAPFRGEYEMVNGFVHSEGGRHPAYDWPMPEGTPLLATADGVVVYADRSPPVRCSRDGSIATDALWVAIEHTADDEQQFASVYIHLRTRTVELGDVVSAGDVIGTSGDTGCSSGPHLHFEVTARNPHGVDFFTKYYVTNVDPYGWDSPDADPWAEQDRGALSQMLWLPWENPCRTDLFASLSRDDGLVAASWEGRQQLRSPFQFFGEDYQAVNVNEDGSLTFNAPDVLEDVPLSHVTQPTIAVMWGRYLYGGNYRTAYCGDHQVFFFERLPLPADPAQSSSATVTLWEDGRIVIDYFDVASEDILVGVFDGTHIDDRFLPVQSLYENFTGQGSGIVLFDAFGVGPAHAGELTDRTLVFDPG